MKVVVSTRQPWLITVPVLVSLFAVSMGLLYATTVAIELGLAVVVLFASTWLLSVLLLALIVRPYFYRFKTQVKRVPEGLAASVEAGCARNGVALRRSWLARDVPGSGMAEITGLLPWDRHLVVEEWFFASLDPAEREALMARETALVQARYHLFSHTAGPAIVAGVAGLLALASLLPTGIDGANATLLLVTGCAVLYGLAARRGVRKVFEADRHAARETSREAVVSLLEKTASQQEKPAWHRWPISLLAMVPTTNQRINRHRTFRE